MIFAEGWVVKIELIRFERSLDDIVRSLSEFEGFRGDATGDCSGVWTVLLL